MAMNLPTDDKSYKDSLYKSLKDGIGLSDFEIAMIREVADEIAKPIPSTLSGVETKTHQMEAFRVKILNIIQNVSTRYNQIEYDYKKSYDPKFVQLTRAGRPNQQSVDSEIHLDQTMQDTRLLLRNYESFRNLMFGYLKSVDTVRDTCMQRWRSGGW